MQNVTQTRVLGSGSPHARQNRQWRLFSDSWRLLSRLDRQIGDGMVHSTV